MSPPAIILVGYDRPASLKRLLDSIERANYSGYTDIPLIISIDGGGDPGVTVVADQFNWKHGTKELICHSQNLELRKHVLSCGDLSEKYGSVIVLEDDLLVSRNFYHFSSKALGFYANDERIAGIGLYAYAYNENAFLPFSPLTDGNSVYFLQHPCSWGQVWTKNMWQGFRSYYENGINILSDDPIPESVKNWPECSWKKYFAKYLVTSSRYFVQPQQSCTTNFADPGENWNGNLSFFQVPLEQQDAPEYKFIPYDKSHNKYDAYFEILPDSLIRFGAEIESDTCIDLYGSKQYNLITNKYLLSSKTCQVPINSYGSEMKPLYQNILNNNPGKIFKYGIKENFSKNVPKSKRESIWEIQQAQGFYFASKTRYFKLGFYLLNPLKFIRKRLRR